MIFGVFDKAIYINLRHREDRRKAMELELAKLDITAERFEAIQPATAGKFLSAGHRGCYLSHLAVIRMAAERNYESVLILEDDIRFGDYVIPEYSLGRRYFDELQWDMIYGDVGRQAIRYRQVTGRYIELKDTRLIEMERNLGTHCYAVHRRAYGILLETLARNKRRPLDLHYWYEVHPYLNVWGFFPPLATQVGGISNVTHKGIATRKSRVRNPFPEDD